MSGNYTVDTNIVIALFRDDKAVVEQVQRSTTIHVSSIVLGELYYGAEKSAKVAENIARIDQFVDDVVVVGCDRQTSLMYGKIRNKLRGKGRPIPDNDVWIAAIAIQNDFVLVTRDKHFQHIDDLSVVRW
ncbi:MAG: type II toxin-antitoxin system VapC family toxin [Chloroflexota bacterium]